MRKLVKVGWVLGILVGTAYAADPKPQSTPKDEQTSLVITFKDGHQQSFLMADIARVEYKDAADATVGPEHFLGKWEAGAGDGAGSTFFITFEVDGEASKSIGASHGTWTIVGDEARLSWDDGWHDVIRKVGDKYEKFAFAPGTTFDDKPENVTGARKLETKP
ncbi:MAG: hypothetical protein WB799_04950 [Candidatus Sulfotelmatobacter sp.]